MQLNADTPNNFNNTNVNEDEDDDDDQYKASHQSINDINIITALFKLASDEHHRK